MTGKYSCACVDIYLILTVAVVVVVAVSHDPLLSTESDTVTVSIF